MFYSVHIPRCTHIKTNGTQCGSPALRGRRFCYFHKNWREQRVRLNAKRTGRASITLPVLEDADSIQVLRLILAGQIDSKIAGLLLYGLQTASLNLRSMQLDPVIKTDVVVNPAWVRQTGVGDQAWCEEDFDDEAEDEDEGNVEEDAGSEYECAEDDGESVENNPDVSGDFEDAPQRSTRDARTCVTRRPAVRSSAAPAKQRARVLSDEELQDQRDANELARFLLDRLAPAPPGPEKKPPASEALEKSGLSDASADKKLRWCRKRRPRRISWQNVRRPSPIKCTAVGMAVQFRQRPKTKDG